MSEIKSNLSERMDGQVPQRITFIQWHWSHSHVILKTYNTSLEAYSTKLSRKLPYDNINCRWNVYFRLISCGIHWYLNGMSDWQNVPQHFQCNDNHIKMTCIKTFCFSCDRKSSTVIVFFSQVVASVMQEKNTVQNVNIFL